MEDKKTEVSPWRRAYGVTEFAQLYFPGHTPVVAYKRMWEWIRTSRGLKAKLEAVNSNIWFVTPVASASILMMCCCHLSKFSARLRNSVM